ncbi:hypothetical protein OPAG_06826 [Rhodococcus opacus PD630]|nr:hypothetical protein Pd630_LPD16056 [Rhodococcus opacus PD630]EHI43547.1 hypothetical protein OPAG_06826 [Rhodococcus opacus PD630]
MKRVASALLAVLVLADCGNADSETGEPSSSTRAPVPSVSVSATATATATSVGAQPVSDVIGRVVVRGFDSSCASAGVGAPIDLTGVSVHLGGAWVCRYGGVGGVELSG